MSRGGRSGGGSRLTALITEHDGVVVLCAPAIGWWEDGPIEGCLIGPSGELGSLQTGSRRATIVMPAGPGWRVRLLHPRGRRAVGYGDPLLRLEGLGELIADDALVGGETADAGGGAALAVVSPTDGVFFHRPSPGAPPFVEPGSRVHRGQPVGLVEVMKTYNQVLYGAAELPAEAEVVRFVAGDGEEVSAGQPLVLVEAI